MLVLSRKKNQSILVGNIVISIKQIKGNRVSLGIEAPKEVRIIRGEKTALAAEAVENRSINSEQTSCDQAYLNQDRFLSMVAKRNSTMA